MRGLHFEIAVVDDEKALYGDLAAYFKELLGNSDEIKAFISGEAFLSDWRSDHFDLIVLDIYMDRLTGMEVAREIRKTDNNVKIAFSTSSNEFSSESYEVNACYYLHKPFGNERVKAMLDRIDITGLEKMRAERLPDGTSVVLRNVIYADCASHYVTLHNKHGGDTVVRLPFSVIETSLCAYPYFFSPTKGIIINFYEVTAQSDNTFCLNNGITVPISRRKLKDAQYAYSSFLFEKLRNGGEG